MSTSESLKGRVTCQNSANAWETLVSAWEREIASKWVSLTLNAWAINVPSSDRSLSVMAPASDQLWSIIPSTDQLYLP